MPVFNEEIRWLLLAFLVIPNAISVSFFIVTKILKNETNIKTLSKEFILEWTHTKNLVNYYNSERPDKFVDEFNYFFEMLFLIENIG